MLTTEAMIAEIPEKKPAGRRSRRTRPRDGLLNREVKFETEAAPRKGRGFFIMIRGRVN